MKQIQLFVIIVLFMSEAYAQHYDSTCSKWKFEFSAGIWNPSIRGDLSANSLPSYINVSLNDKLKSPDYFLSAGFQARKNKLTLTAQFNMLNLTGENTFVYSQYSHSRSEVKPLFITAVLAFDFYTDKRLRLELSGGARWHYIRNDIEAFFLSGGSEKEKENRSFIDPLTGIGFQYYPFESGFLKNIFIKGHIDVGGFGLVSFLSSESYLCTGFALNNKFSLRLGYRYIDVNYGKGNYIYNAGIQGFELSAAASF